MREAIQAAWRQANFGTPDNTGEAADDRDVNGNGFTNFGDFAFGFDPQGLGSLAQIEVENGILVQNGMPGTSVEGVPGGVRFKVIYPRRKDHLAAGIIYTVQFSNELQTWFDSGEAPEVVAEDGPIEAVCVNYPFFLPNGRKAKYFRVVASRAL